MPQAEIDAALRRELIAYLESGETDMVARQRLEALPGGKEMLTRALSLRSARAHFTRGGPTVAELLREKHAEREAEAERDRRRDAFDA